MKVFVNSMPLVIFKGAKVKDIIVKYCTKNHLSLPKFEELQIRDKWGHIIGEDATLNADQEINVNL